MLTPDSLPRLDVENLEKQAQEPRQEEVSETLVRFDQDSWLPSKKVHVLLTLVPLIVPVAVPGV